MKKTKIAINGFGRIGRAFYKLAKDDENLDIVAINDLGDIENIAYLLKYDSVYGQCNFDIEVHNGTHQKLIIDGKEIQFLSEEDPSKLPWKQLGVEVVLEATGRFREFETSKVHLEAGAKRVVISAPVKDNPPEGIVGATVLMGINDEKLQTCDISSNASCTTNAGSPLLQILHDSIGIQKAVLNTIHGYTASQNIVDGPKKDFRRGRAAGVNMFPTTTGAAIATTKAITEFQGKFDGIAIRVPIPVGSLVDITFITEKNTSVEEVNDILKKASGEDRWKNIFTVTEEPIVSSDIIGKEFASIADLTFTKVVDGNLVKVLAWYDNEMGYTRTLVDHVIKTASHL